MTESNVRIKNGNPGLACGYFLKYALVGQKHAHSGIDIYQIDIYHPGGIG